MFAIKKLSRWSALFVFVSCPVGTLSAQDLNTQASNICSVAAGTFITGQYNAQQVLGQQAFQLAQQQTGGTGRYQVLQAYGQQNGITIDNPHYDPDPSHGQLFHFFCTTQHDNGSLQWELKFAADINKLVYYSFVPAQPVEARTQQDPNIGPQPLPNTDQQPLQDNGLQPFPKSVQQPPPNSGQQSSPNNEQQSQVISGKQNQTINAPEEEIKYFSTPDQRFGGIASTYIPFPASWKQLENSKEFLFEGPGGVKVSGAFGRIMQFSNNAEGRQMIQMSGEQNVPPFSLQQIIDEFFMPLAKQENRELVRTYPLPDFAQYQADFNARLFKSVPVQQKFEAYALEWKDDKGLSYLTSLAIIISEAFPVSNWSMIGQYVVAENEHFDAARQAFLYGKQHTEVNPKWLKIVNEQDARRAGRSWAEHQSRMSAIQARGAASRSIAKIYSEISDITHAGYLNNSALRSEGHALSVRAINETTLITNPSTGERYEVAGQDNHHWVNGNGVHISTDNPLFDPRTDEQLKMFSWSKFNREQ